MDKKTMEQMSKMVDAVQPHCDETIIAAMTCSHAGSMSSTLLSKFFGGAGAGAKSSQLPNPVFIAVGPETIYAFKYAPRGFNSKIKKEVARWPKEDVEVVIKKTGAMATFDINTASGKIYPLEVRKSVRHSYGSKHRSVLSGHRFFFSASHRKGGLKALFLPGASNEAEYRRSPKVRLRICCETNMRGFLFL